MIIWRQAPPKHTSRKREIKLLMNNITKLARLLETGSYIYKVPPDCPFSVSIFDYYRRLQWNWKEGTAANWKQTWLKIARISLYMQSKDDSQIHLWKVVCKMRYHLNNTYRSLYKLLSVSLPELRSTAYKLSAKDRSFGWILLIPSSEQAGGWRHF